MESAREFLECLYQKGVRMWAQNGQLHYRAPKGKLLPEDLQRLRTLKVQVMDSLQLGITAADEPLQPRGPGTAIPLAGLQLVVWNYLRSKAEPRASYARFCIIGARICGPLDVGNLERSLESLIHRHESLRTRIVEVDGDVRQQIDEVGEYQIKTVDVVGGNTADKRAQLDCLIQEFVEEKITWDSGPFFAARLFKLSNHEHVLVLSIDHMITDGVSNEILLRELLTLYREKTQGLPRLLPPLGLQFGDYAVWQQQRNQLWLEKNERYWKEHLQGAPRIQLPFDSHLTEESPPVGAMVESRLGKPLTIGLRNLARRTQTLPALVMFTVYLVVIARWCGQRDIRVTFVENGRFRPELLNMIGWLTNHIHLRVEMREAETFVELLNRVTREFYAGCSRQDYNQVDLLIPECSDDTAGGGLYFNWLPTAYENYEMGQRLETEQEISVQEFPVRKRESPAFTLGVFFSDSGEDISVLVAYRTDRFVRDTIESLVKNVTLFAKQFIQSPRAPVGSISFVK
jgi:hypothetical protein